ncbi:hypothetical protein ACFL54_02945 [Planctomycetota bacterium]
MKFCKTCHKEFSDLLELCPECNTVLVLNKANTHTRHVDNNQTYGGAAQPDAMSEDGVLFTGNRPDVDYLRNVLITHDIPCHLEPAAFGQWDLIASPVYADAARELLEDIFPAIHRQQTMMDMDDLDKEHCRFDVADKFQVNSLSPWSKAGYIFLVTVLILLAAIGAYALIDFFL